MTDDKGDSEYSYDLLGRVERVKQADGKEVRYAYDEAGNLGAITYADGRVVYYTYDKNDRLIKVKDGDKETAYVYDAIGRVTETIRPEGSTSYGYDEAGGDYQYYPCAKCGCAEKFFPISLYGKIYGLQSGRSAGYSTQRKNSA